MSTRLNAEDPVPTMLRQPLERALIHGLLTENAKLEQVANDPRSKPAAVQEARSAMREADVLIRSLERDALRGDLYAVSPELTRQTICTAHLGLPPAQYPFAGVKASSPAQAAVLSEVREAKALPASTVERLRSAARAALDAPLDTFDHVRLDLMGAACP